MPFEQFPYTNFHELNLDWIIDKVKECLESNEELKEHVDNIDQYIQDNLPSIVASVITQMIQGGTLLLTLDTNVDADSEYMTITLGGV